MIKYACGNGIPDLGQMCGGLKFAESVFHADLSTLHIFKDWFIKAMDFTDRVISLVTVAISLLLRERLRERD